MENDLRISLEQLRIRERQRVLKHLVTHIAILI